MMLEIEKPIEEIINELDRLVKLKKTKSGNVTITLSKKIFEEYQFNYTSLKSLSEVISNKIHNYTQENENKIKEQVEKEIEKIKSENKPPLRIFRYVSMALER